MSKNKKNEDHRILVSFFFLLLTAPIAETLIVLSRHLENIRE